MSRSARQICAILAIAPALLCMGCGGHEPSAAAPAPATGGTPAKTSPWIDVNGSAVVGVPDEPVDAEMNAAIEKARTTAPSARERWAHASASERSRWFIKWAAPTADNKIEHVWVQPINWSAYRIEGTLTTNPIAELECGRKYGEIVSFPIEELSDWLHFIADPVKPDDATLHEGGFTNAVLEKRFGKPVPVKQ